MIRVFLDSVDISNTCEVDLSFVEKLDMELDEAFVVLGHTKRKDPYNMFSIIDIFQDNTLIFSGRISQDNVELSSFSDEIYNHRITLTEHTKLLEKFVITGKSFTQPLPETDEPPYTLLDVIQILQKTTPLEVVGLEDFVQPFKIPQETEDLLDGIISPEFNFKDVNLREALNEVFFYLNGIARVDRTGDVYIERFNDLKNEIDIVTENYKKDQNIANYSTMMSSDILNSVNTEVGFAEYNAEWYPGRDLWTTPRSDTLSQFDFERSFIPTPKPIYQIENVFTNVEVVATEDATGAGGTITTLINDTDYTVDLKRSIEEKAVYDSLGDEFTTNFLESTKRNTIYYRYGNRNIFIGGTFGLFDVSLAYRRAVEKAVVLQLFDEGVLPQEYIDFLQSEPDPNNLPDTIYNVTVTFKGGNNPLERWNELFRVKYTPITPSIRYEVAREDVSEVFIDTKSIVNQKLRIVDLERFTNNMKGRVNQLGSSELILSHKVSDIADTYNIGDFTADKFVITKKEVIVQRDHYIVNYELNKNFNKMSQFMGIDQEIRQFEVGERGRTIDRDLNYNEYIEIYSVNDNTVNTQNNTETLINPDIILNSFNQSYPGLLFTKYAIMKSPQLVDEDTQEQIEVLMPIYKVSGGNAFGFYMDFETNTSGGDQLVQGDNDGWFNFEELRRYNLPFKYTDKIGRLDTINLRLFRQGFLEGAFEEEAEFGNQLPVFSKDSSAYFVDVEGDFYVKKDNRERLKFTLLYHLLPKNVGDVVIGQKLATHNPYFLEENIPLNLRLWTSDKLFTVRDNNTKLTDQDTLITSPDITIDFANNYVEVNDSLVGVKAWAITDGDGYPLIMVNSNNKRLVFEYNNKRSNVQYRIYEIEISDSLSDSFTVTASTDVSATFDIVGEITDSINFNVLDPVFDAYEFKFENIGVVSDNITFNVSDVTDAFEFKNVQVNTLDNINFNIPNPAVRQSLPQFIEVTLSDSFAFNIPNAVVSQTIPDVSAPIITDETINQNDVVLKIDNPNNFQIRVFYSNSDSTPDGNERSINVDADTFALLEITQLDDGTTLQDGQEYTFYFKAWTPNLNDSSSIVSHTFTTQAAPTYDITFDPNGGTWSDGTTDNIVASGREEGDVINSAPLGLTRYLFSLDGWSPSLPYTVGTSDATLTAQWSKAFYKVEARINQSSSTTVQMQVTSDSYGEQFQGILTSQYSIIADGVPINETFELFLNAPSTFDISGVTYTLLNFIVNGASYNGVTVGSNKQLTLSNLQEDIQVVFNYSSGGGFEPI